MKEAPAGFSELEYARKLCEDVMGWPSKGNLELVGDCIRSIAKAKRLTLEKAYGYLARAVKLAREQGMEVNHFFFANGEYMNVRPVRELGGFRRTTEQEKAALIAEQSTPEWQELSRRARETLAKLAGKVVMP